MHQEQRPGRVIGKQVFYFSEMLVVACFILIVLDGLITKKIKLNYLTELLLFQSVIFSTIWGAGIAKTFRDKLKEKIKNNGLGVEK